MSRTQIITKYAHFVSRICDTMVERDVSVTSLRTFVLQLPAFASDQESKRQGRLLSEVEEKLEAVDSVDKIVNLIGRECASFLNYGIFKSIMDKYCGDLDCDEFNYPTHLKDYVDRHNVKEFFDVNPQLEKFTKNSKKLKLKMDIELTCKVARIVDLKYSLGAILGLRPSALRLYSVEEGCVIVTFLIPAFVKDAIFKKITDKQKKDIQALSVLWMECDEYRVNFVKKFNASRGKKMVVLSSFQSCTESDPSSKAIKKLHP